MNDRLKILHLSNRDTDPGHLLSVLEDLVHKYVRYPVYTRKDYLLALTEVAPDIIIADEHANAVNPAEALQLLGKKKLIIPLVLMVSESMEMEALSLLQAGAADYVVKEKLWRLPYVISSQMKQRQLSAALVQARSSASNHSRLIRRNRNLEQFTYIISHNLRAPVANMMGLTALLKELHTDHQHSELLAGLNSSIRTMDTIINDINQTLQTDNNLLLKNEHIYFQQLVDEITLSINHLIVESDAVFRCDFTAMPVFSTVRGYMYSIFYNIILNSIKYRREEERPLIVISNQIIEDQLVITFKDNGKGIDMEQHGADLFSLYKRIDTSIEGKGMGMFMIKTHVEDLNGNISLESQPGKGTDITIQFPLHGDN